jgi:hypothetical protein
MDKPASRLVAIVACLVLGWGVVGQQAAAAGQVRTGRSAVGAVKPQADQAETLYRELAAQQEQERRNYSGPQAMEMSLKVQTAKQQSDTLRAQQRTAQSRLDGALEAQRQASLRLVPLIAVCLVHALLLGLIIVGNPGLFKR